MEKSLKEEEADLLAKKTILSKEEYTKKSDALRKKVIDYQSERRSSLDKITTQRAKARETLLQKVKHIGSKASGEQKFLGKTLPRMALGAAKLAWKHPITTTVAWLAGSKMLKQRPGLKFPEQRQFDKRGRKFT